MKGSVRIIIGIVVLVTALLVWFLGPRSVAAEAVYPVENGVGWFSRHVGTRVRGVFSRMDLGRNEDHPEPVSLKAELTLLQEAFAPEYAEKGMGITFAAESEGRVLADPETLHRIVSNIAENSCKYGAKTLKIALREEPAFVAVTFTDDGPGVPQEALPYIFDAFYRADPARNEKIAGSGLGLAIVSRAVRNMGGRIIAKNLQPQGLMLEIQLPRTEG
mgnify:CR=1 FL=1